MGATDMIHLSHVELWLYIVMEDTRGRQRSIRVSKDGVDRPNDDPENPYLPSSMITVLERATTIAPSKIRMPRWLAKDRGLIP